MSKKPINFMRALTSNQKIDVKNTIIVILMPLLVYLLVYVTGGIKYSYSHLMYVAIILAATRLGPVMGVVIGIYGGILLGPLMPLDIDTGTSQQFINWFLRLIVFALVGGICGYTSSSLKKSIKTISNLFSHHPETLLPNKNYLREIEIEFTAEEYTCMTVIINNYELIVDLLGIDTYHRILKKIYMYLKRDLPSNSIIIQSDNNKLWIAKEYNEVYSDIYKVLNILKQPLNIDDITFYSEFSLGVNVVSGNDVLNLDTYKKTDIAARQAQKQNVEFVIFHKINLQRFSGFELLGVFIEALSENQTTLDYQPKIDVESNKLIGLEALIRWQHPTRGLIMPNDFILIAETQLIHQLTTWVLKKVIKKIKDFLSENIDIHISINVSVKNLLNKEFFNQVIKIVEMEKIDPSLIEFEITESELMVNPDEAISMLQKFQKYGFQISLDDFGKGYFSLAYLSKLPVNIIKIDKGFVNKVKKEISERLIVKSTIELAHKLKCKTLAEGIEDEETFKIIKRLNCDYAQGFFFARPIRDGEIIPWVKSKLQGE